MCSSDLRIDPVRFISNYSTGTFGYAIAEEAAKRGCRVRLISGPTDLSDPDGVKTVRVETAAEMKREVDKAVRRADCLIMAAAVSDWRVRRPSARKIKRRPGRMALDLVQNPDIIGSIGQDRKKGLFLVGFALETGSLEANALKKLCKKGLDMIVANALGKKAPIFGDNIIDIVIIDRLGNRTRI